MKVTVKTGNVAPVSGIYLCKSCTANERSLSMSFQYRSIVLEFLHYTETQLSELPDKSGVYCVFTRNISKLDTKEQYELIFVGKTTNLKKISTLTSYLPFREGCASNMSLHYYVWIASNEMEENTLERAYQSLLWYYQPKYNDNIPSYINYPRADFYLKGWPYGEDKKPCTGCDTHKIYVEGTERLET